jgi:hypothetical protein
MDSLLFLLIRNGRDSLQWQWIWRTSARAKSLTRWGFGSDNFRAENYNDPQENLCLLRDLRSLLTSCLKVVHYMHRAGLAHCDFKDNMLMKKLDATPPRDSPLAWC